MDDPKNNRDPASLKVYILDDMSSMRFLVKKCLNSLGFFNITEYEEAKSALDDLTSLAEKNLALCDYIISDINMPEMTGLELLRFIRSNQKLSHIPIIFLSAEAMDEDKEEAKNLGAYGYIEKPFTKSSLVMQLNKLLIK